MPANNNTKEALMIMFGQSWQKRFWSLDGQNGRPSIADCIEKALSKNTIKANEDLVSYVEKQLLSNARRLEKKHEQ